MATYYCPTAGEVEDDEHGGFDVCCDKPELHEPEPVMCPDCDSLGRVPYWDGRTNQSKPCDRCGGEGAIEP